MSRTTDLEIRMKTYENVSKNKLMRRYETLSGGNKTGWLSF